MPAILMIPNKHFPCRHAMLETVYTRLLPGMGYDVTWLMLSCDVTRRTQTTWNGTTVFLFPSPRGRGLRMRLREIASWIRLLTFGVRLAGEKRFDLIQVRNGLMAGCVAFVLARIKRMKSVFQFSFPIAESLIQAAREGRTRIPWLQIWHGRLQIIVRTWLLRHVDLVLAISDEMRRRLVDLGVHPDRVVSFPLGADRPSVVTPDGVELVRRQLGLSGEPLVLYFGVIDRTRQLDFLLDVARIVRSALPETRWLILGSGDEKELSRLKSLADEMRVVDVVHFVDSVPRADLSTYLSLARVSVSPIPPGPLFDISSPTKTVESLAHGCPVVATSIPDQTHVVKASGGGIVVPFRKHDFAKAVVRVLSNTSEAKSMGARGREYVRLHRSYEVLTRSLAQHYEVLLARA